MLATAAAVLAGCVQTLDRCERASPGASLECPIPDVFDRAFSVRVPAGWNGSSALPVVIAFHGGGGNRASAETVTCPNGEAGDPGCLTAIANAAGYALVMPDGTGLRPTRNVRSWNAGGGRDGWQCVSRGACQMNIDDVDFFDRLVAELERVIPIDRRRIFLTGLSNGGAISHRLACARPDVVAGIATVGGTNQFVAAGGACTARVPVLAIHGTEDPCWPYDTASSTCAFLESGRKVGVETSTEGWRDRNGCSTAFTDTPLPDSASDGTRATRRVWTGCSAAVERIRVEGGGHTWPGGNAYLDEATIGRVSRDFRASDEIVRFFDAHPRP